MKIHFISIGGSVMHQLALALRSKGYEITGSDDEIFEPAAGNLEKAGILPSKIGWDASRIHKGIDAVILGMHARANNPELIEAQRIGIPIYSFPEYIYKESTLKKRVVIGGSHGKTTTTSMIMHALRINGLDFDYLVGARLPGFERSVQITDAPILVAEGDEYPASAITKKPKFHFLFPNIAVLTGIGWDHINVFPTYENYLEQFILFIEKIEKGGSLIYNIEDPELVKCIESCRRPDLEYLPYKAALAKVIEDKTFAVSNGQSYPLSIFGRHNLLNLEAARLVCEKLGITTNDFWKAMENFTGASKRLELMAENEETVVFRDFAHAPSKVKATIEAVRQQYPRKKLIAALELHTYSSLSRDFMPHYAGSLDAADDAAVFYSPHAMEIKKMPSLPGELVREGFNRPDLAIINKKEEMEKWLEGHNLQNTIVLLMSSGTFDGINIPEYANKLLDHRPNANNNA